MVFTCPEADQFLSGAKTVTSAIFRISWANASKPGAVTPSSFVTKMCMIW
jgi:hypothetical protein